MAFSGWREAARSAAGLALGIGIAGLLMPPAAAGGLAGMTLIAPFAATGVLLFALPNSPLAQPWSAIVGNTVSALVAVATLALVDDPLVRAALASGLSILAMHLCRALHPPGGAVALTAALNPGLVQDLGPIFALVPVALGTAVLVACAAAFAPATGRRYPFRVAGEETARGTTDTRPEDRLPITRDELAAILREFRQSANIGVEDLARLIAATERRIALHHDTGTTAADIMSRDLVTVGPATPLSRVADLFRQHGFTSLPVVGPDMRYLGVIFQIHLIRRGRDDALRLHRGFGAAMRRLLDPGRKPAPVAGDVMSVTEPRVTSDAPLAALMPALAEGNCDAVPVVDRGRISGIVTRSDLIAALVRLAAHPG